MYINVFIVLQCIFLLSYYLYNLNQFYCIYFTNVIYFNQMFLFILLFIYIL